MPLPDGWATAFTTPNIIPLDTRGAGTYTSDNIVGALSGFTTTNTELWVYVSGTSGSATLDCSLETSDDGTTWTPIPGSTIPTLSAPGSGAANIPLNSPQYLRATSTVSGTGTVTYRLAALVTIE
jgi:hypothetical protein